MKEKDINLTDEALKADMSVLHSKLSQSGYTDEPRSTTLERLYIEHINTNMLGKDERTSKAFETRCHNMAKIITEK